MAWQLRMHRDKYQNYPSIRYLSRSRPKPWNIGVFSSSQEEANFWQKDGLLWNMLKRQSFHQSTANVRTVLGMVLVFSIFQSHKYHKLLPQHLSSAIQPPVAPQATHGKRHLCANVGDLILVKAQHLQGPVAAQSLCKRLRKRNLGNSSANISACDNVCVCQMIKLNPLWTSLSNRTEKSQVTPFAIYEPYVL